MSVLRDVFAYAGFLWACGIVVVQAIGSTKLFRWFSSRPRPAAVTALDHDQIPHVTIIRPVKGLEPQLYECIASTFQQNYPIDKLAIYLCVADTSDPAYPVLKRLIADFPQFDARVFVESEDPHLHGPRGHSQNLGPNPKIRNISRAYSEAKGDIIWIIDCNVWIARGVAGRMVDKLMGYRADGARAQPYKFVHQLPLVVDTVNGDKLPGGAETESLASSTPMAPTEPDESCLASIIRNGGGRLDEMFMATSHAKFYSAINTVGVAPCIVGKSNMFRKSHVDMLTDPATNPNLRRNKEHLVGIDYFSSYICEDHLIGDLLWRADLPGFANHGLVFGDFAIQPMAHFSVSAYAARRARWLRARKWTVLVATLVEPGVESLVCAAFFSLGLTSLPRDDVPHTWSAAAMIWFSMVTLWMTIDRCVFNRLHAGLTIEIDDNTPSFVKGFGVRGGPPRRRFPEWFFAWITREVLALPIWTWAVLLGTTVSWRGKLFRVRMDMSVVELGSKTPQGSDGRETGLLNRALHNQSPDGAISRPGSKNRID